MSWTHDKKVDFPHPGSPTSSIVTVVSLFRRFSGSDISDDGVTCWDKTRWTQMELGSLQKHQTLYVGYGHINSSADS